MTDSTLIWYSEPNRLYATYGSVAVHVYPHKDGFQWYICQQDTLDTTGVCTTHDVVKAAVKDTLGATLVQTYTTSDFDGQEKVFKYADGIDTITLSLTGDRGYLDEEAPGVRQVMRQFLIEGGPVQEVSFQEVSFQEVNTPGDLATSEVGVYDMAAFRQESGGVAYSVETTYDGGIEVVYATLPYPWAVSGLTLVWAQLIHLLETQQTDVDEGNECPHCEGSGIL